MAKRVAKAIRKARLLLIEPNSHHQELLTTLILNYPHKDRLEYSRAQTMEDAIALLTTSSFDLILSSDFNQLPDPNCWSATLRTRHPGGQIILLTTTSDTATLSALSRFGLTEIMIKSQENLALLPELIFRYLGKQPLGIPPQPVLPAIPTAQQHTVKRILKHLNKLSDFGANLGTSAYPLKSIRSDLTNLTKILKDLL